MEGPQQVYTCEFSRSISRGGEGAILTTRRPTSSAWGRSGDFQKLIEFYTNPDSTGDNAQLPDSTCVHYRYVKRIVQSDGALNLYIYIYISGSYVFIVVCGKFKLIVCFSLSVTTMQLIPQE